MEVIVITQPGFWDYEHKLVKQLFEAGLKTLHVRKPDFSTKQLADYLDQIPEKHHKRIVIHSHHELVMRYKLKGIHLTEAHRKEWGILSWKLFYYRLRRPRLHISTTFHHLSSIRKAKRKYDYVILSPVFESISKDNHKPEYSLLKIQEALEQTPYRVVGVGGMDEEKIVVSKEVGFYGLGFLGCIWKDPDPAAKLRRILASCA